MLFVPSEALKSKLSSEATLLKVTNVMSSYNISEVLEHFLFDLCFLTDKEVSQHICV